MAELDIEKVKARIAREKAERLLAEEKSKTPHGGDKIPNEYDPNSEDLDENYPMIEGKRRIKRAKKVESDEEKSPLQ